MAAANRSPWSFPIGAAVRDELAKYPNLQQGLLLPSHDDERSDLVLIRYLNSPDLAEVKLIERLMPISGEIGNRLLRERNPLNFRQTLSELYALDHFRKHFGEKVSVESSAGTPRHDLTIVNDKFVARVEINAPFWSYPLELVEDLAIIVRYANCPLGFRMEVEIHPLGGGPESFESLFDLDKKAVEDMAARVYAGVEEWLNSRSVEAGTEWAVDVIPGALEFVARLAERHDDPEFRSVSTSTGVYSSDIRQLFDDVGQSDAVWLAGFMDAGWARKLRQKMCRAQAGAETEQLLRILLLDFSGDGSAFPEFISDGETARHLGIGLDAIVRSCERGVPYDVVLPARLGPTPRFGNAVVVRADELWGQFAADAGLDRSC